MKKILLYSGGMDSWIIDKLWKPDEKYYINLHTKYSKTEIERLPDDVKIIDLNLSKWERKDSILPLRNLYMIMAVLNETKTGDVEICLGANNGDRVLDKSIEFKNQAEKLLNYLYESQHWIPEGRKIKINLDYRYKTKTEILKEYLDNGGDIEEVFNNSISCYHPEENQPCWHCKSCMRKFIAFSNNNYKFKDSIADSIIDYMEKYDDPRKRIYQFGRGKEEEEKLSAYKKWKFRDR